MNSVLDTEFKLIKEYSFRDLMDRFVELKNYNEIKLKCIHKYKESKNSFASQENLFGYFYIDHKKGLMLNLIGNVTTGKNLTEKDLYTFTFEEICDSNVLVKIFNNAPILKYKDIFKRYFEKNLSFPHINNIIKTRQFEWLDIFRDKYNPDILTVTYKKNSRKKEHLNAIIYNYDDKNYVLSVKLLSNSILNLSIKINSILEIELSGNSLIII